MASIMAITEFDIGDKVFTSYEQRDWEPCDKCGALRPGECTVDIRGGYVQAMHIRIKNDKKVEVWYDVVWEGDEVALPVPEKNLFEFV